MADVDDATAAELRAMEDGDPDAERVELALRVLRAMVDPLQCAEPLGAMGAVADLLKIASMFDVASASEPLAATASVRV